MEKDKNIGKGEFCILARYEYDELGRRTVKSGYVSGSSAVYEYDLGNRLTRLTNNLSGSSSIVYEYPDYDKVGNRLSMKIGSAEKQIYQYDKLYQLTSVDYNDGNKTTYEYDKRGNRSKMKVNMIDSVYEVNILNQYVAVDTTPNTYDRNGNLTCDGTFTYIYDCENRLTEVHQGENTIAVYKYDFAGRRVAKIVGSSTTTFLYDGDQIIADYDGSGVLQRQYLYGSGIDEPICMIEGLNYYYYYYDGLGSVTALAQNGQAPAEVYSYDVFGEPNRISNIGNRFMFTGREFDPDVDLYYYRARFYNPQIGRFIQPDPVSIYLLRICVENPQENGIPGKAISKKALMKFLKRDPIGRYLGLNPNYRLSKTIVMAPEGSCFHVGLNLYDYCGNNPLLFVDPYGYGWWGDRWDSIKNGANNAWEWTRDNGEGFYEWVKGMFDTTNEGIGGAGEAVLNSIPIISRDQAIRNLENDPESFGDNNYNQLQHICTSTGGN